MLRSRVGVAVMKNRLYAIGGYNGSGKGTFINVNLAFVWVPVTRDKVVKV